MSIATAGDELVGNIGSIQAMPRDIAILKMEHDSIAAMAVARPRDFRSIAADITEQFEIFPAFAKSAIYSKPVGDKKFVRNLSVRAAEAIAEAYGYCRVRTTVDLIEGHPDLVRVEAIFTDYQKGKIWEDAAIVSKWYKARSGGMVKIPDDRFFQTTVRAAQSKVVREVILRSVAPGLRLQIFDQAEKSLAKLLDDSEVEKIVAAFAAYKVTEEMIERFVGRPRNVGWTQDDRLNLIGAYTAVKDGDATVAALFSQNDGEQGTDPEDPAGTDADLPEYKPKHDGNASSFVAKKTSAKPVNGTSVKPEVKPEPDEVKPEETKPSEPETAPAPEKSRSVADYRRMIMAAKSERECRNAGELAHKDKSLTEDQRKDLLRLCQKRIAVLIGAGAETRKPQQPAVDVSKAFSKFKTEIEAGNPEDDEWQGIAMDIAESTELNDVERDQLLGLMRAKAS